MNSKARFPSSPKLKLGILGGTFDYLHSGHKAFLEEGFNVCQKMIIGLTSEEFIKNKLLASTVLPFEKRKKELEQFLKSKDFLKRTKIIKIDSPFPPEIFNPKINCLIITKKTEANAEILNSKRKEKKLLPLKIINLPIVTNNQGECISSEKIRLGQMDRKGRIFVENKFFKKTFFLPQNLRQFLKKPLGELISGSEKDLQEAALKVKKGLKSLSPTFLITVGDIVTLSLVESGLVPDLMVVDFKVKRKEIYQDISELGLKPHLRVKEVKNRAGTLNPDLFSVVKDDFRILIKSSDSLVIRVLGEEDLAALPAVLLVPLNSLVCYGQPEKGIVIVKATEKKKQEAKTFLHQFQEKTGQ